MAEGVNSPKFIALGFINVVIAANAGGAFSPFGDITTLMVWQKGLISFSAFFVLFIPALVNFLVPAIIMSFAVPKEKPDTLEENTNLKRGAKRIVILFFLTITTTVSMHNFLHLPPVLGMMTGLAYLQFFAYFLKMTGEKSCETVTDINGSVNTISEPIAFNIFNKIARAEWDTLLFFFGVILVMVK